MPTRKPLTNADPASDLQTNDPLRALSQADTIGPERVGGGRVIPFPSQEPMHKLLRVLAPLADPLGIGQPEDGSQAGMGGAAIVDDVLPYLRKLLGRTFEGGKGTDLNDTVRLTSYDPHTNGATLHSTKPRKGGGPGQEYNATMSDVAGTVRSGELVPEGGPFDELSVEQLVKKLLTMTKRASRGPK